MALEIRDRQVGRPRAVSRTDAVLDAPRLAASAGGAIAAVWQTSSDALAPVQFAVSPAAGRPFSARRSWRGAASPTGAWRCSGSRSTEPATRW